jgi:hypothetical protein
MPVLGGVFEDCERAVVSPAPRSWVGRRRHPRNLKGFESKDLINRLRASVAVE